MARRDRARREASLTDRSRTPRIAARGKPESSEIARSVTTSGLLSNGSRLSSITATDGISGDTSTARKLMTVCRDFARYDEI